MFQVACLFLPFSHWFWLGLSVMSLKYPGYWWSEPLKLNQSAFYTRIFFFLNWNRRVLFPLWFYYYKKANPRVLGEVTELQLHSDSQPQKEGSTQGEAGARDRVLPLGCSKDGEPAQAPRTRTSFLFRKPSFGVAVRRWSRIATSEEC